MKRVVKIILYGLGILILVLLMAALFFSSKFNREFEKVITFEPVEVIIPQDSVSIERGRILSVDCRSCHGPDLAGKVFLMTPLLEHCPPPTLQGRKVQRLNITPTRIL